MSKVTRRGFDENDSRWFSNKEQARLKKSKEEIEWLISREYKIEHVIKFVGDRYKFSIRQRNALKRGACSLKSKILRSKKRLSSDELKSGCTNIDGFNLLITLEVALSGGTLIIGSDGCIRDLAGLRGTYKIIDKTDIALQLIGKFLIKHNCNRVIFYLDSPVSNSGKLKNKILEHSRVWNINTEVNLVNNADVILENLDRVVSTDAVIIDKCKSYFNLASEIIRDYIKDANIVDLED